MPTDFNALVAVGYDSAYGGYSVEIQSDEPNHAELLNQAMAAMFADGRLIEIPQSESGEPDGVTAFQYGTYVPPQDPRGVNGGTWYRKSAARLIADELTKRTSTDS